MEEKPINTDPKLPEDSPKEQPVEKVHEIKKPASRNKILWIILILIFAAVALGIFFITQKSTMDGQTPGSQSQTTNDSVPTVSNIQTVFKRSNELYTLDLEGEYKQITKTNDGIYSYKFLADKNLLAFISGEKITNENNYSYVSPKKVFLGNPNSEGVYKEIYSLEPKSEPNSEFTLSLNDVGFSTDGELLGITTSDTLFIYEIKSENLKNVYSKPYIIGTGSVFAYFEPRFTPDKSRLLLTKGYYEGAGNMVVDAQSGEIKDLPYGAYISGSRVVNWIDSKKFIYVKYPGPDEPGTKSEIFEVIYPELNETKIGEIKGQASTWTVSESKIYFVSTEVFNVGEIAPNIPKIEAHHVFYSFDLGTKVVKKLADKILEDGSEKEQISFWGGLRVTADKKKLLVNTSISRSGTPQKSAIYVLDLNNPSTPTPFVQDASF